MFSKIKRIATVATVVAAASAPSAAYASFQVGPPIPVSPQQQLQQRQIDQRQAMLLHHFANDVTPSVVTPLSSPGSEFPWAEVGIGAAGTLVLLSAGSLASGARRRRADRPAIG